MQHVNYLPILASIRSILNLPGVKNAGCYANWKKSPKK